MHWLARLIGRVSGLAEPRQDNVSPTVPAEPEQMVLHRMPEEDERAALRRLVRYVFEKSAETAVAAFHAVAATVIAAPSDDLPWIEELVRTTWRGAWNEPGFVQELLAGPRTPATGVLGGLSFHPNGYVREAAVKRLASVSDSSEVRFLLLRLNDWVPEVREAAPGRSRAAPERLRDHLYAIFFARRSRNPHAARGSRPHRRRIEDGSRD